MCVLFIYLFFSLDIDTILFFSQTVQTMHWILLKSSFTDAAKNRTNSFISTTGMLRNYGQVREDVPSPQFMRHWQALVSYGRETLSLLKWNADEFDDMGTRIGSCLSEGCRYFCRYDGCVYFGLSDCDDTL